MLQVPGAAAERPLSELKGVGPVRERQLNQMGLYTVSDLLLHLPHRYEDWRPWPIAKMPADQRGALSGVLRHLTYIPNPYPHYRLLIEQGADRARAIIHGRRWLRQRFSVGETVLVYGDWERDQHQHPFCRSGEMASDQRTELVPIYPASAKIRSPFIRQLVVNIFRMNETWKDPLPARLWQKAGCCSFADALRRVHFPADINEAESGRVGLAYLELLLFILALNATNSQSQTGIPHRGENYYTSQLLTNLPFQLTRDQRDAVAMIDQEMADARPMYRLLQGDVATGKTIVGAYATAKCVENGGRAVWLVPTRLLAEQHVNSLRAHFDPLDIQVGLVTGESGETDSHAPVLVGTHALLQTSMALTGVSLVVIDEQQRFGVSQRGALHNKAPTPDVLLLSATPIPRTWARTLWGDLAISTLGQSPVGRRRVTTRVVKNDRRAAVYRFIKQEMDQESGLFVVCPAIRGFYQREQRVRGVMEHYQVLTQAFPDFGVGYLHGEMPQEERQMRLEAFAAGDLDILVGTNVLQVGLDVPRARLMVIENAERFGLSELHQLRGRIGRDGRLAFCFLISANSSAEEKLARVQAARDGAEVADADLIHRGMGDFFSTFQHGLAPFSIFAFDRDHALITQVQNSAKAIRRQPDHPDYSVLWELVRTLYHNGQPWSDIY